MTSPTLLTLSIFALGCAKNPDTSADTTDPAATVEGETENAQALENEEDVDDQNGEPGSESDPDTEEGGEDETEEDEDTLSDADPVFEFSPIPGLWEVSILDTVSDSCGVSEMSDEGGPGTAVEVTLRGGDDFRMAYHEGQVLDCSITSDEGDYTCAPSASTNSSAQDMGLDCLLALDILAHGSFDSPEKVVIHSDIEMSGIGDACEMMEMIGISMPCNMTTESVVMLQP